MLSLSHKSTSDNLRSILSRNGYSLCDRKTRPELPSIVSEKRGGRYFSVYLDAARHSKFSGVRSTQLELLNGGQEPDSKLALKARSEQVAGRVAPELIEARSILTRASGFMTEWDYTLNPYAGCGFGCNYCYAAFFARDQKRRDAWGDWVDAKHNAVELIRRACARGNVTGKSIYMSSVTDPYQPVERQLQLTREILRELIESQPHLTVQTRSPLVTRDVDLLKKLQSVQVNMTVTTDSDEVVQAFEPHCPTNRKRLTAIAEVAEAGANSSDGCN